MRNTKPRAGARPSAPSAPVPRRASATRTTPRRTTTTRGGTRLRACVVLASLRGFDELAAHLEPKRVIALLQEFVGAMADVAVAHHAAIDAVLGDGVRLLYGVPAPRRDDPLRAVRVAASLQRAALALRNRWLAAGEVHAGALGLAVGVAAGEVLIADLSAGGGSAGTPVGEPVCRAARLCAAARGGETLVDEATYASASARLDGELVFSARPIGTRSRELRTAYKAQARRAGLRIVPPRTDSLAG
ncbi:MAG: adenylate/guanylate cyclase domain-containing protein [bacterium]